jgi:serine O-acetyltransferase
MKTPCTTKLSSLWSGESADDDFTARILKEAKQTVQEEPELKHLLSLTVLAPWVKSFEDAVASTLCYRMLLHPCNGRAASALSMFCPNALQILLKQAFENETLLEAGHTMKEAVRKDAMAVLDRDPACETLLEVVLFYKGFSALVCHRAARQKWISKKRSMTALFLQSQASAVFALDIHPGATIGAGILLDHGTGIVIGETAYIGDGCTLLHGVTLGGTGKESGDRHPKVGNRVLIGAGSSILGNITIGDRAKIGAGSIVLRPIPTGATAVGAPAKIIGRTLEANPASDMDEKLQNVGLFHKSPSTVSTETETTDKSTGSESSSSWSDDNEESGNSNDAFCCPFRDYAKLSKEKAPKNSITFCMVAKQLKSKGCSHDQVWAAFFQLDKKNVGYFYRESLTKEQVGNVLAEATRLEKNIIEIVLRDLSIGV